MPEPVRTHHRHLGAVTRALDDVTDEVCADRSARSPTGQEQRAGVVGTPGAAQVGGQRLADLRRQRQSILTARLAADNEFAGPPVDVAQLQTGDLD